MRPLRALFVVRPDAQSRVGGDVVQATQTAAELRNLGHVVDIAATADPNARGYDVAHVFGIFDPPLALRQLSALQGVCRIALSPIWWDLTDFFARSRAVERALAGPRILVERRLRSIRARSAHALASKRERANAERRKALQRGLMQRADVLLPNSVIEAHRYVVDLALQHPRVHVVPNAVDRQSSTHEPTPERRAGVLCVGRIESRKNQAMLAYALRNDDVALTLAGECYDAYYRELCERWNARITFTGALAREDALAVMRRHLVHVLPAWLETPGIASLEAAAAGCAVVLGNRACEFEYFRETAWYCDPGDPQSIRSAVLDALRAAQRGEALASERLVRKLTWAHAAAATLEAYKTIL